MRERPEERNERLGNHISARLRSVLRMITSLTARMTTSYKRDQGRQGTLAAREWVRGGGRGSDLPSLVGRPQS